MSLLFLSPIPYPLYPKSYMSLVFQFSILHFQLLCGLSLSHYQLTTYNSFVYVVPASALFLRYLFVIAPAAFAYKLHRRHRAIHCNAACIRLWV